MAKFKKGDRIRVTGKVNLLLENHTAPEATFEDDVVTVTKVHDGYAHAALLFYSITSDELTELTKEKDVMVYASQLDVCAALVE